jgi:hypothetical protein
MLFVWLNSSCQVFSPFELEAEQPDPNGLTGAPSVSVVEWESLDQSVWETCKSLMLLPAEVMETSMKIPYCHERSVTSAGSVCCGRYCDNVSDIKSTIDRHTESIAIDKTRDDSSSSAHQLEISAYSMQQDVEEANEEHSKYTRSVAKSSEQPDMNRLLDLSGHDQLGRSAAGDSAACSDNCVTLPSAENHVPDSCPIDSTRGV